MSKDKEDGAILGTLLGTVFSATFKANQEAKKTNIPVYIEEKGKLYAIEPGGERHFIRDIQKPFVKRLPKRFKLK